MLMTRPHFKSLKCETSLRIEGYDFLFLVTQRETAVWLIKLKLTVGSPAVRICSTG